jgi:hypothetical protein
VAAHRGGAQAHLSGQLPGAARPEPQEIDSAAAFRIGQAGAARTAKGAGRGRLRLSKRWPSTQVAAQCRYVLAIYVPLLVAQVEPHLELGRNARHVAAGDAARCEAVRGVVELLTVEPRQYPAAVGRELDGVQIDYSPVCVEHNQTGRPLIELDGEAQLAHAADRQGLLRRIEGEVEVCVGACLPADERVDTPASRDVQRHARPPQLVHHEKHVSALHCLALSSPSRLPPRPIRAAPGASPSSAWRRSASLPISIGQPHSC